MSTSVRMTLTLDELEHVKAALIKLQIDDEATLVGAQKRIEAHRAQRAVDLVASVEREALAARGRLVIADSVLPKVFGARYRVTAPRRAARR